MATPSRMAFPWSWPRMAQEPAHTKRGITKVREMKYWKINRMLRQRTSAEILCAMQAETRKRIPRVCQINSGEVLLKQQTATTAIL